MAWCVSRVSRNHLEVIKCVSNIWNNIFKLQNKDDWNFCNFFFFQGKSVKSHWFQRYTYSCIETGFSYEFLFWADPVPIHQHYYTFKTWLSFLSWSGQPVSGQPIRCKAQWAQTHTLGLSPALSIEEDPLGTAAFCWPNLICTVSFVLLWFEAFLPRGFVAAELMFQGSAAVVCV